MSKDSIIAKLKEVRYLPSVKRATIFIYFEPMEQTLDDTVYQLSCHQASELKNNKNVFLVFNLPQTLVETSSEHAFVFKDSEPQYPTAEYSSNIPQESSPKAQKTHFYKNQTELFQYARFWHFLGDATHCSKLVPTPNLWYPGLNILVENRYNHPVFSATVKEIALAQTPEKSWVWVVTLSSD